MTYLDLQVNGSFGIDFNADSLDAGDLERVCATLAAQDVGGILATIITDSIPVMELRLRRPEAGGGGAVVEDLLAVGHADKDPFEGGVAGVDSFSPQDLGAHGCRQ